MNSIGQTNIVNLSVVGLTNCKVYKQKQISKYWWNPTLLVLKMSETVNIDLSGEINATTEKKGFQKYVNDVEL